MKTHIMNSVFISSCPEDIERVILDPSKTVLWTTDLEKFEVLSGKPGQVGSKARLHYMENGQRYTMEDELLEVEPGHRYLSRVSGDVIEATVETFLKPEGEGTRVRIHWTGQGKPFFLKLLLPIMRRKISHQSQKDLIKLKELVESAV